MYKYYVNGIGRELIGSWRSWSVYDDSGNRLSSSPNILSAILEADYDSMTWDQANMIESVIIDIMREREGRTCRFQ